MSYHPCFHISDMSIQHCTLPLTSSAYSIFKLASTVAPKVTRLGRPRPSTFRYCDHAHRQTRRHISTATEYHLPSLDPALPPPPRNTNIPDTSIAGISQEVINRRPPSQTGQYESSLNSNQPEKQSISITETEAQKSKPVTNAPSSSPTPDKAQRLSKLRPRKAAMTLTPSATEHLQQLLELPEPKFIRVGVKNRGCSGLAYHLEYVDKAGKFDEAVEQDGVKVLIDSKALFSIIGSEMDWVEDKLNQRFVFRNPNISGFFLSRQCEGLCTNESQRNNAVVGSHSWSNAKSLQHSVQRFSGIINRSSGYIIHYASCFITENTHSFQYSPSVTAETASSLCRPIILNAHPEYNPSPQPSATSLLCSS